MAKINPTNPFSNSLGDYSVYKMQGIDKLIIRAKHGPSKEKIKKGKQYKRFRFSQSEFSGASKGSKQIQLAIQNIKHLKDFTYGGLLTKICRLMQNEETEYPLGARPILFSQRGYILDGFNLNQKNPFDVVVKSPAKYTISRNETKATVVIPKLHPGINFSNPGQWPLFRFIISLGVIKDMTHNGKVYVIPGETTNLNARQVQTAWFPSDGVLKSMTLDVKLLDGAVLEEDSTAVLSIGIEFGRMITNGIVEGIKRSGCGKILGMA